MLLAIPFPDISHELFAFEIGGFDFALRWYALSYIAAILIGWWIVVRVVKRPRLWPAETAPMTPGQVEELVTAIILGIIIGGRLGFVLFYQPGYYLARPLEILRIWEGGMAFHGGLLGVGLAMLWFCRRHGLPVAQVADALALATPPGIMLGRIANFVNAELWGRPTDMPWGVIFPGAAAQDCPGVLGPCARHPSQLYEAGLEGLLLGLLLVWLVWARGWLKWPGRITGMFLAGYGTGRFIVEFYRVADRQFITPDNPMGHVLRLGDAGVTMGQLLSLPMIALGLWLILRARSPEPRRA